MAGVRLVGPARVRRNERRPAVRGPPRAGCGSGPSRTPPSAPSHGQLGKEPRGPGLRSSSRAMAAAISARVPTRGEAKVDGLRSSDRARRDSIRASCRSVFTRSPALRRISDGASTLPRADDANYTGSVASSPASATAIDSLWTSSSTRSVLPFFIADRRSRDECPRAVCGSGLTEAHRRDGTEVSLFDRQSTERRVTR